MKIPAAQLIVPAFPPAIELWRERDQWFEPGSLRRRVRRNRWLGPLCRAPISSASRDSAYPARGSTHSRRVQGAHLALAATRGNRATRGGCAGGTELCTRNCPSGRASDHSRVQLAFGALVGASAQAVSPDAPERRYALHEVKARLHQASFRDAVLAAYGGRCAISRLPEPRLLDAAHIVIVGQVIQLPRRSEDRPDRDRLALRFGQFRKEA